MGFNVGLQQGKKKKILFPLMSTNKETSIWIINIFNKSLNNVSDMYAFNKGYFTCGKKHQLCEAGNHRLHWSNHHKRRYFH